MNDKRKILAVDTGLTGCKAIIFSLDGHELGQCKETTPVISKSDGTSEIDMDELWQVVCRVIRGALKAAGDCGRDIVCAGFSGHGNGAYCIDSNGKPVGHAISSMDTRAEELVSALNVDQKAFLKQRSAQYPWAGQPGMILRWLKLFQPERYSNIAKVLFCKDYLSFKMCDVPVTDFSDLSASGLFDNFENCYSQQILDCLGIPEVKFIMPEVVKGSAVRGYVTSKASSETDVPEGVPVIGGMFDVDACVYGVGALNAGDTCCIAGTWNVNAYVANYISYQDTIRQCILRCDGITPLLIDSSATSAINLEWFMNKIAGVADDNKCLVYKHYNQALEKYQVSAASPYYLPFVNGTLNGSVDKGAFVGLDIECGKEQLYAAVCEGICFAHRWHLENLELCGAKINNIKLTGGTANSEPFCQLLADITGKNVETVNISQAGAFGIWAASATALGLYPTIEAALDKLVKQKNRFVPNREMYDLYEKRFQQFKALAFSTSMTK